jgi:hypothetical protein
MKSIYKLIFYALAMLTLSAGAALGWQLTQAYTYNGSTGQPVTVAWQADPGAASYQVQLYHQDHRQVAGEIATADTRATLELATSGRYWVQLRSIDSAGNPSAWHLSTNPADAVVAGQPVGWQLFAWVAPAGGADID